MHSCFLEGSFDSLQETLQAIGAGNKDVLYVPVTQLGHDQKQELGFLRLSQPHPQHLLLSSEGNADGEIGGLHAYSPLTHLHVDTAEVGDRIERIQGGSLPSFDLFADSVGDGGNFELIVYQIRWQFPAKCPFTPKPVHAPPSI